MNRYFGLHTLEGEWHALLPRYLFLADRVQGRRVLDIGCGTGLGSSLLLELGAEIVDGLDHRPAVLELARMKHAKQGLDFHVMLPEELEFAADTFDLVLCLDPANPITDPNLLREVRRVLKPGGEYVCAIERKTVQGFESVLPRYGYSHTAERIELPHQKQRVPQIGELSRYFPQVLTIMQRPQLGFAFDMMTEEPATGEERRRVGPDIEEALQIQETQQISENSPFHEVEGPERWLHVDKHFCTNEADIAGVELWFCGNEELHTPRLKEVRLPYYSLMERLKVIIHELHSQQRPESPHELSLFDEVIDHEATEAFDTSDTLTLRHITREEEPTQIRRMPLSDEIVTSLTHAQTQPQRETLRPVLQLEQLDAHLSELDSLHRRIKTDFDRLFYETRAIFDARDSHLHDLTKRLAEAANPAESNRLDELLDDEVTFEDLPRPDPRDLRIAQLEAQLQEALAQLQVQEPAPEVEVPAPPESHDSEPEFSSTDLEEISEETPEAASEPDVTPEEALAETSAPTEDADEEGDP